MDSVVTLLFLVLWIAVAFFVLRFFGQRYFHEPRRADVAALGIAVAFALGALWPYSARLGSGAPPAAAQTSAPAATPPAQQVVGANVLGTGDPPGTRNVSATCRSTKSPFGRSSDGSIDDVRADAQQSAIIADGGRMDQRLQYIVDGWAADPAAGRPALGVCLMIDGKVDARGRAYFGVARPDLASGFHHDELTPSGYLIAIPPGLLSRGRHRIQVLSRAAGGKLLVLPAARNVTVY